MNKSRTEGLAFDVPLLSYSFVACAFFFAGYTQGQTPVAGTEPEISAPAPTPPMEVKVDSSEKQSLEDLLKTEVPQLAKENNATNDNWKRLVEALSKNEFEAANGYAATLLAAKDILSPMRLEYCVAYEEIAKDESASTKNASPTMSQILELDRRLESLKSEKQSLLEERPKVYKKIEDKNRAKATSAILGTLIGAGLGAGLGAAAGGGDGAAIGAAAGSALGAAGGYGYAAADSPEVRLQYIEKRLQEISVEKISADGQLAQLRRQLSAEDQRREEEIAQARVALRDRVIRLMGRFAEENEFQPSVALANAFLKIRGMDSAVSLKSSEIYQEQSKVARIVKIAQAIQKEVREVLGHGSSNPKPWTASSELEKKTEMAKNSIQDPRYNRILEKELFSLREELETTKTTAGKQRDALLALGQRDAEDAFPKLEAYGAFYQDDPDYNSAWLQMKDLREKQAEERVRYHMSAVEETMEHDPEKAKTLLVGLLEKEVPPVERTILEAKIAAAFQRIHSREILLIRTDVDEAQGYLTKYSLETGSSLAEVDLSSLQGQFNIHQQQELNQTTRAGGLGLATPLVPISGDLRLEEHARGEKQSEESSGSVHGQKKFFSFAGRLFVGVENIERCLSLLEGANVRVKKLQQDQNLDKLMAGRLDGLAKSIEVSLGEIKKYRENEVSARKVTWAALSSGIGLMALAGTGGLLKLSRRKSSAV